MSGGGHLEPSLPLRSQTDRAERAEGVKKGRDIQNCEAELGGET